MSVKISIFKSTADGEQLNQEFNLDNQEYKKLREGMTLRDMFDPYFHLADQRLLECNLRIIMANKMVRALPPEAQVAVHSAMEVLHGQRPSAPEYVEILRQGIADAARDLVKNGVPEDTIRRIVTSTYGDGVYPQAAPDSVAEGTTPAPDVSQATE